MNNKSKYNNLDTQSVHAGKHICPTTGAMWPPIYHTVSYMFDGVEDGAKKCKSTDNGYCYTRLSNPTLTVYENKIAEIEGGEAGLSFASGVAATSALLLYYFKQGDHAIVDTTTYSATHYMFEEILGKFGVEVTFINTGNIEIVQSSIKPNTKMIYSESPANPTVKIVDLKEIAALGKKHNILTVVDSTFATPYCQKPLDFGMDVVMHSSTKYLCGHGDTMGGVLIGSKELMDKIRDCSMKNVGGILSPFNAFMLLRGLKTFDLRMEKHCANAIKVAEFLESHSNIEKVYYPGLKSHPQYDLAKRQMKNFGGVICFEVKGGVESGIKLMENLKLCSLAVSIGHCETLIEHPASMTHFYVPKEERLKGGITDGLVRISIGIENVNDIIEDLNQALELIHN